MDQDLVLQGELRLYCPQRSRRPEPADLEDQYIFVKEIPAEYKCLICSKLLREPQFTECCGQHFCQYCLEEWLGHHRNSPCPMCRTTNCNYMRYLPMKREIDDMEVYCTNKNSGYEVILAVKDIQNHIRNCDFAEVNCSCGQRLLRKELKYHVRNTCPNRQVRCPYCSQVGPYHQINSQAHQSKCPDIPVYCPNQCGATEIKRKNLANHRKVCPLVTVECPYSNVGCKTKMYRRDLKSHQASNTDKHLHLVTTSFSQLKVQHDKIQKENSALKKENSELKKENTRLKQKPQWATSRRYRSDSWQDDDDDAGYMSTSSMIVESSTSNSRFYGRGRRRWRGPRYQSGQRSWETVYQSGQRNWSNGYQEDYDDYPQNRYNYDSQQDYYDD